MPPINVHFSSAQAPPGPPFAFEPFAEEEDEDADIGMVGKFLGALGPSENVVSNLSTAFAGCS
jgi:hypothetical protein